MHVSNWLVYCTTDFWNKTKKNISGLLKQGSIWKNIDPARGIFDLCILNLAPLVTQTYKHCNIVFSLAVVEHSHLMTWLFISFTIFSYKKNPPPCTRRFTADYADTAQARNILRLALACFQWVPAIVFFVPQKSAVFVFDD